MSNFGELFRKKDEEIEEKVREKYRNVSESGPGGLFNYPTGEEGLRILGYPRDILSRLPDDVKRYFCGVGNPVAFAEFSRGKRILDIGCGAGLDAIVSSLLAGPESEVTGVDLIPEMVHLAAVNAEKEGVKNVTFVQSPADKLPFPDGYFDVLISNGVFNLIPDKEKAISEWFRVMKNGGEAVIADMSLEDGVTEEDVRGKGAWSD